MKVKTSHLPFEIKLQRFIPEGLDVELFAVSHADAAAEAYANCSNQVYFGKGQIILREGDFNDAASTWLHRSGSICSGVEQQAKASVPI